MPLLIEESLKGVIESIATPMAVMQGHQLRRRRQLRVVCLKQVSARLILYCHVDAMRSRTSRLTTRRQIMTVFCASMQECDARHHAVNDADGMFSEAVREAVMTDSGCSGGPPLETGSACEEYRVISGNPLIQRRRDSESMVVRVSRVGRRRTTNKKESASFRSDLKKEADKKVMETIKTCDSVAGI